MSHALTIDGFEGLLEKRERSSQVPKVARRAQPKAAAKNAEDAALVAALAGGERGAWNAFVGRFAGVVYAAWDPELDRLVAIKVLRSSQAVSQERLLAEARTVDESLFEEVLGKPK